VSDQYDYDVFLSFRRFEEWPRWVRDHFAPILRHWLGEQLGRQARIFVDDSVEEGSDWPDVLGRSLAGSAVLVPLLSGTYFASKWCSIEFDLMERRAELCGDRRLIVPAVVHDGERLPPRAQRLQGRVLNDHVRMRMAPNGGTAERLESEIKAWVPRISTAIEEAPERDPGWVHVAVDAMDQTFQTAIQEDKPTWSA
jgi:TIR domain